ncbi:MAG TPA: M42 family metallopeptidase [Candidatus Deferrimicrobium sp.]|nr:M42 family metallopeptidase [Candidatus Deferrimicrobium sp.]
MNAAELKFLKELSESFGPSGYEREALDILKKFVKPFADEIKTDKLGSLLFTLKGNNGQPTILIPGHIDEVGFCVSGFSNAYLKFVNIGGWFDQVLLGHRVRIRTSKGDLLGVIAAKPPHLISLEERKKVVERNDMFIDIGCKTKEELEDLGVKIGDPIVPVSEFTVIQKDEMKNKVAMGKALDDRIGVCVSVLACKKLKDEKIAHPNTVIGAASTQEELGARGARTLAHLANPDVAIICETDISGDIPGIKEGSAPAKMGEGVAILTFERTMIPNQALKEFVIKTAEQCKIPHQLSMTATGGTDGGSIHLSRAGCPSIVLGVPTRHIHSPTGIFALNDLDAAVQLVIELIKQLDSKTVQSFIDY